MTNAVEKCTEITQDSHEINDTIFEEREKALKIHPLQEDKIKIRYSYLLQIDGDPEFKLSANSARKNGKKAVFTSAGWVYQKKEEAEEIAKNRSKGKRKIKVVRWFDPLLDVIWYDSKEAARIAKQQIKLEIDKHRNNKQKQEIEMHCYKSGLHHSWLNCETLPDFEDFSENQKKAHAYYKPLWDQALEEQERIELREDDINVELEDLKGKIQNEEVIIDGIPKKITDMQSLDHRFAQLEAPGQPCVLINRLDSQPISQSDFKSRLSGEVIVIGTDTNSNPKYVSASKFWIGNSKKRIYKKIVFTNSSVDDSTYNLFSGFGIKPKKGNCEKILNHIKEVICSNDEINNDAFLKLLAWQLQNIGKPSRIITALKSTAQQAGKGCLLSDILAVIYGNAGFVTSEIGQIVTRFNDTIRGKAYIFLDEALFSGDRKAANAIKSLATCTRMGVETKGIPTVQFPIAVNLFLATNHDDAAHIEESDARYWILEVSPHKVGNTAYFKDLYEEIENGGREALMDYLLSIDISNFIPSRDIPKYNAAKEAMIRNSINPYDARKWLEECCDTGMLLGYKKDQNSVLSYENSNLPWEPWKKGVVYENGIFFTAYKEWQKSIKSPISARPTPLNKFGELLNIVGLIQTIEGGKRWRKLPSIEECLKSLHEVGRKS